MLPSTYPKKAGAMLTPSPPKKTDCQFKSISFLCWGSNVLDRTMQFADFERNLRKDQIHATKLNHFQGFGLPQHSV